MSHTDEERSDENAEPLMAVIDARCGCAACEQRTTDVYRMVSLTCLNCRSGPFLMIFRSGDKAAAQDCPVCKNWHTVHVKRPATADEIPAAVAS